MCVYIHICMYLYHLLITLYQVIQNPCSLNYTLADTVPFDLKQEEGTPYGWRRSVSLTETHTPPIMQRATSKVTAQHCLPVSRRDPLVLSTQGGHL